MVKPLGASHTAPLAATDDVDSSTRGVPGIQEETEGDLDFGMYSYLDRTAINPISCHCGSVSVGSVLKLFIG